MTQDFAIAPPPAREAPGESTPWTPARGAERNLPAGYIRGFIVALVVLHHSVLAYVAGIPLGHRFAGGAMLWRAFPVLDSQSWAGAGIIAGVNDTFFMSLMFLLSGLFVWRSLKERGAAGFMGRRAARLGAGFLLSAGIIAPIAYATAYLQAGGAPDLTSYWRAWTAIGYWPTGPAWFVLLLLLFDLAVGAATLAAPGWGRSVGRVLGGVAQRPARLFALIVALSALAYAPLAYAFTPDAWSYFGPLQFQSSRPLLYLLWFIVGVGLGAGSGATEIFAPLGPLARRWALWCAAAVGAFLTGVAVFIAILATKGAPVLMAIGSLTFVLTCAGISFAIMAIFARFAQRRSAIFDSLARNSYGIYLVHYAFVAWIQFAVLGLAAPAPAKAALVTTAALGASWLTAMTLRRLPLLSRIL